MLSLPGHVVSLEFLQRRNSQVYSFQPRENHRHEHHFGTYKKSLARRCGFIKQSEECQGRSKQPDEYRPYCGTRWRAWTNNVDTYRHTSGKDSILQWCKRLIKPLPQALEKKGLPHYYQQSQIPNTAAAVKQTKTTKTVTYSYQPFHHGEP